MTLTRSNLKDLAGQRLREARVLLHNRQYDGAYYLAGLAVECALKACIARRTRRYDFPDKQLANESYTHNLARLLKMAGLVPILDHDSRTQPTLSTNWAVVKDWDVDSRYTANEQRKARDLYAAISARRHGVMTWIRQRW